MPETSIGRLAPFMPDSTAHLICLTGGVATGKSRVAQWFASRGWQVLCSDEIVHHLYEPGQPLPAEITSAFGPGMMTSEGRVDRKKLGSIVFSDPAALQRLNALVHPRVRNVWKQQLDDAARQGRKFMTVIPLAYEADVAREFQQAWVVGCSAAEQTKRMRERGIEDSQIERRLASQWPLQKKMDRADLVIWNSGPWLVTEEQLKLIPNA